MSCRVSDYARMHAYMHAHTHTHACTHARMHASKNVHMHACTHAHARTRTHLFNDELPEQRPHAIALCKRREVDVVDKENAEPLELRRACRGRERHEVPRGKRLHHSVERLMERSRGAWTWQRC